MRGRLAALAGGAVCCLLAASAAGDDRSTVRFEYACASDLGRRDVTLFANGTVRVREGPPGRRELYLDELLPEELASALGRLEDIHRGSDRRATALPTAVADGGWVEQCEIRLALPGADEWSYRFSDYEVPPLELGSLIQVADDLAAHVRPVATRDQIRPGYRPEPGEVLRTADGQRFRVVRPTADGFGLELEGLDSPLQIFVAYADVAEAFAAIETAGEKARAPDAGLPVAPDPIDP